MKASSTHTVAIWRRFVCTHPRLLLGMVVGALVLFALQGLPNLANINKWLIAWNVGTLTYLLLVYRMARQADHEGVLHKTQARYEDEGQSVILLVAATAAVVSVVAIVWALSTSAHLHGHLKLAHIGLTCLTIALSWLLIHVMFALHYARAYYQAAARGHNPGLSFPGDEAPDYPDFLYFSCIIGTSGQTADVSFTSRRSRRIGTLHCILAFFYNASILALMINIAAGLISN